MKKVSLQLRLDTAAHAKIKTIAEYEERTINSQIEYFLKRSIEQYERENSIILSKHDVTE